MVLLLITAWWPHDKANDVGRKYVELAKKYPPTPELGENLTTAIKVTKDGIKSVSIAQAVKGKVEEYISHLIKYQQEYAVIEGFRYELEMFMDVVEALAVVGMKPPEEVPEIY
jgi:hypothetical protein